MEAEGLFEKLLVIYQSTRRHIPEHNMTTSRGSNPKSHFFRLMAVIKFATQIFCQQITLYNCIDQKLMINVENDLD
jgi:hypothetical protein